MTRSLLLAFLLALLLLAAPVAAWGQVVQLPLIWVNNLEYLGVQAHAVPFPVTGTGGSWACHALNYGPYTANSQASAQQAVNDAEACRAANPAEGVTVTFPAGSLFSGANGLVLPQTLGDLSNSFIVLTGSLPLPTGFTACSHGIQDNVPASKQPGIRNLGCNATNLSYQLGTTVTPVAGAFTLANGTATNTSAYNDIASMWTVECTGTNCNAISTGPPDVSNVGPHHYAILNAEIRPQAGLVNVAAPVIFGTNTETMVSQLPAHMHLAYSYVHGDWTDAPVNGGVATAGPTGANSLPHLLNFAGCVYCSLSYSYMDRAIRPGSEGHAISLLLAQQIKIDHNWVEGQSIGHLCGGFSGAITIPNFVTCQDEEDRGNRYTYPWSWILAWQAQLCPNNVACAGHGYVRKNAHEYKFGERVVEDGNIYENVDNSGAQNGTVFSHKTAQTSAGSLGTNYWTTTDNFTVTNIVARNTCNGPSFGDRSDTTGSNGGGVSLPTQFFFVSNLLVYNASTANPGCNVGGFNSNPQYAWRMGSSVPGTTWAATAQRDATGSITTLTLTGGTGFGVSNMSIGDPVTVYGCSDSSFNVGFTTLGPSAITGTLLNGLTVVYPNAGTANATATGCTFSNAQGWPNAHTFSHITMIDDTSNDNPSNSALAGANIWPFARNFTLTNSVLVNGTIHSSAGYGTATQVRMYDSGTETVNNDLNPGQSAISCTGHTGAACFTEYGGLHAGASPPVTIYLTPTSFCTGNDPTTGNCAGILAGMSTSTFPITTSDWHNYRLCHVTDAACNSKASLYAAGQANQGSDAADLGVNPAAVDLAEVATLYVCSTPCGTGIGPYPDVASANPLTLFGFTETNTAAANFPTVPYEMQRFWDSPPLQWPSLNTAAGVYNFANLDTALATSYAAGQREAMYTLARTPPWATSQPGNSTTCHYGTGAVGGGNGECFRPADLNADGSGTNATWKAWVTKVAQHANGQDGNPTYLLTHAHIRYWEVWNEPDAAFYWHDSFAALARLTEDANCLLTGRGVIHQSGNGTATPCTAAAIDPTAQVVMASGHADSPTALKYAQNQLYCSNTAGIPSFQLPCPNPVTATSAAVDIVNFHMKPGNAYPATLETTFANYLANIAGILQSAELAKPLWDGELSYADTGNGFPAPYNDPDMASGLFARLYLTALTGNVVGSAWYSWDSVKAQPAQVQVALQQAITYLTGATLTAPCAPQSPVTVYECTLSKAGASYLVVWDNAQTCAAGICTHSSVTVPSQWTTYQDMTAPGTPLPIPAHVVPAGIKPVILQAGMVVSNPPAPATQVLVKVVRNELGKRTDGGSQ